MVFNYPFDLTRVLTSLRWNESKKVATLSQEFVLTIAERGIFTILLVAGPILLLALTVGLLVSIFQATTQIQEQTLAFIPKIIAVLLGVVFFGQWMLSRIIEFTTNLYQNLNQFVG